MDDHPLVQELASLRQTAARFQHEAHAAAIKLQHHALDTSRLYERIAALEQHNVRLAHELSALRATPEMTHHPAEAQAHDLALALRRASEKTVLTETALLERTAELTDARSELARARHTADAAYELAARMRAREEAGRARERDLEFRARASDEERKMVDLVVQEYADLVRNLEGRKSSAASVSSLTLVDNLQDDKSALHTLLTAFSTETDALHATIAELNAQISDLQLTLNVERTTAAHDRTLLSQIKTEMDKLGIEDQTAAKMVARYMKFSQASTNALQDQITSLKARHAEMIATLELQLSITESQFVSERAHAERLQYALDELCEDLARESYGRRREVSLRLALLLREEGIAECMRRWVRKAKESYTRCYPDEPPTPGDVVQDVFHRVVSDAEFLLSSFDDDVQFTEEIRTSGSLARIALSNEAVEALRAELRDEVQRRVEAIRSGYLSPNAEDTSPRTDSSMHPETPPTHELLTSNGSAKPDHNGSSVNLSPSQVLHSPVSVGGAPEESTDDPFVAGAASELEDPIPSLPQDSSLTSTTLLVKEEPDAVQHPSPAVSMLDLGQSSQLCSPGEPQTASPNITSTFTKVPVLDKTSLPSTSMPTPMPEVQPLASPSNVLLTELGTTKHRYDDLRRAFRDCCLALKEIRRTLASSPSSQTRTKLCQYLETALSRIDDYAEDARVELEIRIADEELTMHGFETVLSVPRALVDADERAEVEASARAFVDGTDDSIVRALHKFGKKLGDVQHDIAVVKRAVHGLATPEGQDADEEPGTGWSAWTAGLLGNVTPSRSPTPVQTFGAVMTSPRLRPAELGGLDLRIPMPPSPSPSYTPLGLGRVEGQTPRRTLSAMYAVGGLRSSSVGLGVGFGGTRSPVRPREGGIASQHDLGGVE